MSVGDELITVSQAARLLGVSGRRVQQLAASGDLTLAARGLVERTSAEHQLATRGGTGSHSHTRAWSAETAWAAVALLCGVRVDWLGTAQKSRLQASLRATDAQGLVSRTRNRARIHRYTGHASTAARLRSEVAVVHRAGQLGLAGDDERFDGYVATDTLAGLATRHGLLRDPGGHYALRATDFDLDRVAAIAAAEIPVLAALDSAQSLDAREAGVGRATLDQALARFRG